MFVKIVVVITALALLVWWGLYLLRGGRTDWF